MRTWGWLFASLLFSAACTKPNPAKHCTDGTCTTPSYPFCDVTGAIGGEEGTCIAVTCTAGEFGECRGDSEVRCSANEHNYSVVQCERGCDPAADGCRLCSPNETACTNGKLATCDASGAVTSMTACPLGCFEDEPRCRDIAPSNGLASYLDMVASPPDLDLSGGGSINTGTGQITDAGQNAISVPSFLVSAPPNGAAIRVFVARRVRLGNVEVVADVHNRTNAGGGPALAIVAADELTIEGELTAWAAYDLYADGLYSAGGVSLAGCTGGAGNHELRSSPPQELWTASGGGGHATAGGNGGSIEFMITGGDGGTASGSPTLEPLRGGCAGGPGASTDAFNFGLGGGGGAIQLSSRVAVRLTDDAIINASGGIGVSYQVQDSFFGGGAGGGILLEAPTVVLGNNAKLLVNGGPGASASEVYPPLSRTRAPSIGGKCTSSGTFHCADGGNGAGGDGPATAGGTVDFLNTANHLFRSSGGGGGLGYIRINTRDGSYTKASTTIESGVLTTGSLKTR